MLPRRALLFGLAALAAPPARAQYQPQGRELVERLLAMQAENGELQGSDTASAAVALRGMLLGAPPRLRQPAAEAAKRWLSWRRAQTESPAPAHMGPLLAMAVAYLEQSGDAATFNAMLPWLEEGSQRLAATVQASGLLAPGAAGHSLEMHLGAWQGWDAMANLAERTRRTSLRDQCRNQADALLAAIDRWFWVQGEGCYAALLPPGERPRARWSDWSRHWEPNLRACAILPADERRGDLIQRLVERYRGGPGFPVPFRTVGFKRVATVQRPADLEHVLAWGAVVLSRYDQAELERFQLILSRVPWSNWEKLPAQQIGEAIRVGGGQCRPAPPGTVEEGVLGIG